MVDVKFRGSSKIYPASFIRRADNLIELIGDLPRKETGFSVFRQGNGDLLGKYNDYSTIYVLTDNGIVFSNDGSVQTEPDNVPEDPDAQDEVLPTIYDDIGNKYAQTIQDGKIVLKMVESFDGLCNY